MSLVVYSTDTYVFDAGGRRIRTRIAIHVADSIVVGIAFARLAFGRGRAFGDPLGENLQKLFHQVQIVGIHLSRREQRTCGHGFVAKKKKKKQLNSQFNSKPNRDARRMDKQLVRYNNIITYYIIRVLRLQRVFISNSIDEPFDSKTIGVQYPNMFFVNFTCFLKLVSPFSTLKSFLVYAVSASTPEKYAQGCKHT